MEKELVKRCSRNNDKTGSVNIWTGIIICGKKVTFIAPMPSTALAAMGRPAKINWYGGWVVARTVERGTAKQWYQAGVQHR